MLSHSFNRSRHFEKYVGILFISLSYTGSRYFKVQVSGKKEAPVGNGLKLAPKWKQRLTVDYYIIRLTHENYIRGKICT